MTASGATSPLRTSRMKVGEVYVIALRSLHGEPTTSRYDGDQLQFRMSDGNTLYTEPYVGERLRAAAVRPDVDFEMLKVETVTGNRRTCEVVVRCCPAGGAAGVRSPAAPSVAPQGVGITPQFPNPTPPAPALVNGQGQTHADLYVECFREAVRIAPELVAIAKTQGFVVSPVFEDLRCIATHLSMGRPR